MDTLTVGELRSDLLMLDSPLFGGFTRERERKILETAIHFAGLAAKYNRVRETNRRAQKTWRKKRRKNVPRET